MAEQRTIVLVLILPDSNDDLPMPGKVELDAAEALVVAPLIRAILRERLRARRSTG